MSNYLALFNINVIINHLHPLKNYSVPDNVLSVLDHYIPQTNFEMLLAPPHYN